MRLRRLLAAVSVAALFAAATVAIVSIGRRPAATSGNAAAIPVEAGVAERRDVPDSVSALGTVQSIDTVAIQARISGSITKIGFTPGQDVKSKQELFLIDPRPYEAALRMQQAQLVRDQAVLAESQVDLARYQTLEKQNSIARQQAEDQYYVVQQNKGTVELDQSNVESARLNVEYCHIVAPISGRAGALLVDLGNLAGPTAGQNAAAGTTTGGNGATASSGQTLVTITQMQPIYVTFNVPQDLLDEVRHNQAAAPLEVQAYSQAGKLLGTGKLTLIDNHVNSGTGTVMLQGTFANTAEEMWPGEFVRVQLIVAIRRNVVTVPLGAVMAGPNGDYVYAIEADRSVKRVAVKVAVRQAAMAVISEGLTGGESVVTNGQYRLDNGTRVAIRQGAGVVRTGQAKGAQ